MTDTTTRAILAAAAERVRAERVPHPADDVDHHINDVIELCATAVLRPLTVSEAHQLRGAIEDLATDQDTARTVALREAEQIASTVIGPLWHLDTLHEITSRLRAAAHQTTT